MSTILRATARRLAHLLLKHADNSDFHARARNGEHWLMRRVGPEVRRMIDVGYNHGEYSGAFLDLFPDVAILGVEPVPEFYARALAGLPAAVDLQNVALGDGLEAVVIYKKGGGANASPQRPKTKDFVRITPPTTTGDALAAARGFGPAQFIKIDTDGYDLRVLRGFSGSIDAWRPIVQFEFGRFWLDTASRLRDAFDFFGARDYQVGFLTPRSIDFVTYSDKLEYYAVNCNMVAVPSEKRRLFR